MLRSASREETITCSNCSATLRPSDRFCASCGVIRVFETAPPTAEFWYSQTPQPVVAEKQPWTVGKILNRSLAAIIVFTALAGIGEGISSASHGLANNRPFFLEEDSLDRFTSAMDRHDYADANAIGEVAVASELKNSPSGLNTLAWDIVKPDEDIVDSDRNVALATRAASRAVELDHRQSGGYLDTLAWCYFRGGNIDKAIATQDEALLKAKKSNLSNLQESMRTFKDAKNAMTAAAK